MHKCKLCGDKFKVQEAIVDHLSEEHEDDIPKDFTPAQYYYALRTGKTEGKCVVCKNKTKWNAKTDKYFRFCERPRCKEIYREKFKKNMIGKYGKVHLLNSPEQQKLMLANRSISGKYTWSDGTEKSYTGSYELHLLRFLDVLMDFDSEDVMCPSPHTYYYEYEGETKFYIPDVFIASLGLEIEAKDGGDNPNMHHKIQAVDKKKEKLKDEVLMTQKEFSYIKISDKNYDPFFEFLFKRKNMYTDAKNEHTPIFIVNESFGSIKDEAVVESAASNKKREEAKEITSEYFKEVTSDFMSAVVNGGIFMTKFHNKQKNFIDKYPKNKYVLKLIEKSLHVERTFCTNEKVAKFGKEHVDFIDNDLLPLIKTYQNEKTVKEGLGELYFDTEFISIFESLVDGYQMEVVKESSSLDSNSSNPKLFNTKELKTKYYENNLKPVFILLTYTDTNMAKIIKFFTGDPYSHASISFDSSMTDVYSFGRKFKDDKMSFINEDIRTGVLKDVKEHAKYSIYVTFMNADEIVDMKKRLNEFKKKSHLLRFSFIGLFNVALGKETSRENEYFCSQFVAELLKAGRESVLNRDASLYTPYDLGKIQGMFFVNRGKLKNYNKTIIDKKVEELKDKFIESVVESVDIRKMLLNRINIEPNPTESLRKFKNIPMLPTGHKTSREPMVYFGITSKERASKEISFLNREYTLKGVNLSLQGLSKFLKDNNMENDIQYYAKVSITKFMPNDDVEYDSEYDMIAVSVPFTIKIDSPHRIP